MWDKCRRKEISSHIPCRTTMEHSGRVTPPSATRSWRKSAVTPQCALSASAKDDRDPRISPDGRYVAVSFLTKLTECLQKSCDESIAKCKRFKTVRIIWRLWNMVRHDHVWIANLLVGLDHLDEVDISFVRKRLYKIICVPANIAKMHIKYLVSGAKVTD